MQETWTRTRIAAALAVLLSAEGAAAAGHGSAVSAQSVPAIATSLLAPQLSVRGRRAVLSWRGGSDLVLSVAFGETSALGSAAVETTKPTISTIRGAQPTVVVHQVNLDGLEMQRHYYYRGTLKRAGTVVADTGLLSFDTPLAFVTVRPTEIEMHKDGDHDIEVSFNHQELYDSENKGEVYLEWNVKLRAEPGGFPWSPKETGCYPGGASIATHFPTGEPDLGYGTQQPAPGQEESDVQYPNIDEPTAGDAPDDWGSIDGCIPYSYDHPVEVETAKVGSGESVELDEEEYPALDWEMPADLTPVTATGQAIAPDTDGDGEPDWVPGGSTQPAASPCGNAPAGSYALVRVGMRGQEFDQAPGIGTSPSSLVNLTQIINHDASDSATLCLDLRGEAGTVLFGVRAEDGSLEFTTWLEISLEYR